MAEPMLSPRKRKQPFTKTHNHPFSGIFTRSKSRIYLHCNRSGRARRDASRLDISRFQSVSKKPKGSVSTENGESSYANELPCILIKDLRTRRVFSDRCGLRGENEEGKGLKVRIEGLESGFAFNSCFGKSEDNTLKVEVKNPTLVLEEPRNDDRVGGLNGGCDQKTPPDSDVLVSMKEVKQSTSEKLELAPKIIDEFVAKLSNGSNQKNDNYIGETFTDSIEKRNCGPNSRSKSILSRCSRGKVFKAPGSFSYRRLLPYLMDISKDDSDATELGWSPKCEKDPEEKTLMTSHVQKVLISVSRAESFPVERNNLETADESNLTSIEHIKESLMPFESQKEVSIVEEWPKPILEGGIDRFDIKICSEDQKLNTSNCSIAANYEDSCAPQNISTFNGSLCSIMNKRDSSKDNEVDQSPEDIKQCTIGGLRKSDVTDSPQEKNLYQNSNLCGRGQNDGLSKSDDRDDDVEAPDHADNSGERCTQMTPPDADIFDKPVDQKALGRSWDGSIYRNSSCLHDKGTDSSPRQKLVLSRCSRLKLFKTPGSMSYRRMLPFLMEVTNDDSYASTKGHCLKLDKGLEANIHSQTLVSGCQEKLIGNSNGNDCQAQCYNGGCSALPISLSTSTSNGQEPIFSLHKHVSESSKPLNSQDREVRLERNLSNVEGTFRTAPENRDVIHGSTPTATPLCSFVNSLSLSREDAELVANESSINSGENCTKSLIEVTDGSKQIEPGSLNQYPSHYGTPFHLGIASTAFNKGILKKTPRGCRGLCTCLNCSSFHLHAQRAFEFSRNQMQDAEEVALDLIKELSYVRNMLEKSAFGADGAAAVGISEVKEACRRAAEAEILAQNRLSQMNFDLNIHCRITCAQRPRVRFANNVEERVDKGPNLPGN